MKRREFLTGAAATGAAVGAAALLAGCEKEEEAKAPEKPPLADIGSEKLYRECMLDAAKHPSATFERALAWQARNQRADGSWGDSTAETALAGLAFMVTGEIPIVFSAAACSPPPLRICRPLKSASEFTGNLVTILL